MPYSRESAGKPSSRFASTVSRPCSCSAYARSFWPRPMPAPFVTAQVDDDTAVFGGDAREREIELRAAVAAQRSEDVAGEALGVHAHEHVTVARRRVGDVAADERDVLGAVGQRLVDVRGELAVTRRDVRGRDATDELRGRSAEERFDRHARHGSARAIVTVTILTASEGGDREPRGRRRPSAAVHRRDRSGRFVLKAARRRRARRHGRAGNAERGRERRAGVEPVAGAGHRRRGPRARRRRRSGRRARRRGRRRAASGPPRPGPGAPRAGARRGERRSREVDAAPAAPAADDLDGRARGRPGVACRRPARGRW